MPTTSYHIPLSTHDSTATGKMQRTPAQHRHVEPALRLHAYLQEHHWNGQTLSGPDPGIRFNYRLGRFAKSYLRWLPWNDDYYYLQAQGYWALSNWCLFEQTGEQHYYEVANRCSVQMRAQQRDDGAWEYPNREWTGRIATAEGTWAALGLLESYRHTRDPQFLDSALRWHRFLLETIGFQRNGDQLAVNYFAHRADERVPNNTVFVLRFLAELSNATHDDTYLNPVAELLNFLRFVQQPNGEFPYTVAGAAPCTPRLHFQCYQYNAFQCLDLLRYYEISQDSAVVPLVTRVAAFLSSGVATDGHALYECGNSYRQVTYHAAAVAAALTRADQIEDGNYAAVARRAYAYVLDRQRENGSFSYSHGDYRLLSDQRSYPRYLSMILYHLLLPNSRSVTLDLRKGDTHVPVR